MRICDRCFALLPEEGLYCPECGAASDRSPGSEGSDALVYPEIAKANLFRMKGKFHEAEQLCLGILKRYPNNPTAHILLGDIHADQGNWEQACNWYELAVDLVPENTIVKNKLKRTQENLLSQDKIARGSLPAPSSRWLAFWYGLVILVILAGVTFAVLYRQNQKAREPLAWENMAQPVSAKDTKATEAKATPTPPPQSEHSQEPGTLNPPVSSPESPSPLTEVEKEILTALRSEASFGARIATVFYHVGEKWAVVTASLPSSPNREAILQDAFSIAGRTLQVASSCLRADVRYVDPTSQRLLLWVALERTKYEQSQSAQTISEVLQIVYEERS